MNKYIVLMLLCVLCSCSFNKNSLCNDEDIANIFQKNIATGTMIVASEDNNSYYIFNNKRASTPLSPASTFKIPNSIIAIENGILENQYEVIKWDGEKRFLNSWNQDQNLKSSYKTSCVWFFQELAKRIGKEKYISYLNKLDYGNKLIGQDVTRFWLNSSKEDLKITAYQQIQFLSKLYKRELPISSKTYDILEDIMLEESCDNYKLYSKTGASTKDWVGHGWYVGYVKLKNTTWLFATNIIINNQQDLAKRKVITMEALKKKGIISG